MRSNKTAGVKVVAVMIIMAVLMSASGCLFSKSHAGIKLDPKNPITISVWHYYNGTILNAFETLTKEFNDTVGAREGIIVEGFSLGNISELERAVVSSAKKEVGSAAMPNIFASYADTAYEAEKMGLLANLEDYFTEEELGEYVDSYIEEGKIGLGGELRIFPIAKSTEVLMLNETDWIPFAESARVTFDDLSTYEGITRVAEKYYEWTDAKTPDIREDGKSFFGRDSVANFFIVSSKEFDTEIFSVEGGSAEIVINESVMRKVWDNHYVPILNGYISAYGRYRSDDAKVGDILAYVGSTSSATYFPGEVTVKGEVYPITSKTLPAPHYEDGHRVLVQQGAGMAITKSTIEEEYASAMFLRWFTEETNNIAFSALSGYMPVKKSANGYEAFTEGLEGTDIVLDDKTLETLSIAFNEMQSSEMYTNKAFNGGTNARAILENNLHTKALSDREAVIALINAGRTRAEAVGQFNTELNFRLWLQELTSLLNEAAP